MKKNIILSLFSFCFFGALSTMINPMAPLRTSAIEALKTQLLNQGTQAIPRTREHVKFAQEKQPDKTAVLKNLDQIDHRIRMARPTHTLHNILEQEVSRTRSEFEKMNERIKLQEAIVGLYTAQNFLIKSLSEDSGS